MDEMVAASLGKSLGINYDFFQELLQLNHGLGLQGDDPLIDILNTPISPSHGCLPQQDNCHPVSSAQCIFQLSVEDSRCFIHDDTDEEEIRPLLDVVTPVSVPLPSPVSNTSFFLECSSPSTTLTASAGQRVSSSMIPVSSGPFPGSSSESTPLTHMAPFHPPLPPLPSPSSLSPEAFLATVLKDPIPSTSLSTSSQLPTILPATAAEVSKQPIPGSGGLFDTMKQLYPGLISSVSNFSPSEILQALNALGDLQTSKPVSYPPHSLEQVSTSENCLEADFSPYSSATLSSPATPILQCQEYNAIKIPANCDTSTTISTPPSVVAVDTEGSCQPSPTKSNDCTNLDEYDYHDSVDPSVLSSFTHIDWTNKNRCSPSVSSVAVDTCEKATVDKIGTDKQPIPKEQSPKPTLPQKRHAGGWPKGRPRRKDRQVETVHKPKLPLSGYAIFLSETRRRLIEECPQNSVNEINKELGRIWSTMEDKQKGAYYEKAAVDKKRYLSEVRSYIGSKLESSNENDSEVIVKAIDAKFIEMVSNDQDNKLLWCEVCNKRFVTIANKFAHIESKSHLGALMYTLEKMVAVLSAQNLHKSHDIPAVEPSSTIVSLSEESEDSNALLSQLGRDSKPNTGSDITPPLCSKPNGSVAERTDGQMPSTHVHSVAALDDHRVTSLPLYPSRTPDEVQHENNYLDLQDIFSGPATSLDKLLNDFGKITEVLSVKCSDVRETCGALATKALDLQIECGELEYLFTGVQQELSELKGEHKSLERQCASFKEWLQ